MPNSFDLVCVGNAVIDNFLRLHNANHSLRYSKETNELCIKFGRKIIVEKSLVLLGGNAANVAVGASRLGLKSAIVAEIGKDDFGEKIIKGLERENVNTENLTLRENQKSSFSTIISFNKERTIFSEHVKRKHDFVFDKITTKWLYLTSLGEEWQDAYEKVAEFIRKTKALLIFNPGALQLENSDFIIEKILPITELLFVNRDEAAMILNNDQSDPSTLLKEIKMLGPKIVVITDGKNGSFAIDKNDTIHKQGVIEVDITEKTGAGDAFSSGFLSALFYRKPIEEAMVWGAKNSSSTICKIGAQVGLLYKKDLL